LDLLHVSSKYPTIQEKIIMLVKSGVSGDVTEKDDSLKN
jgi:hypothetical protein